MGELINALEELNKKDVYPFHMPGHKRQIDWIGNSYKYDITEIEGFDDLHNSKSVLKKLQDRLAVLYKSKRAYLCVNGSTGGILASIAAVVEEDDLILVARNCHKSVYNGVFLKKARAEYIYPQIDTETGITKPIKAEDVENFLNKNPQTKAVVITSPTYEGIITDIDAIAEVVHRSMAVLIVDAAHGAYTNLGLNSKADIIVMSLHKTLPCFTQTAVICVNNEICAEKVRKYISIFETSSPSYLFMAGVEACLDYVEKDLNKEEFDGRVENLRADLLNMKKFRLFQPESSFDKSKIVIETNKSNINGVELKNLLLSKYDIELEMASEKYVLAMTSCVDTEDGFLRLVNALKEIDGSVNYREVMGYEGIKKSTIKYQAWECDKMSKHDKPIEESEGNVCGEYIYAYPPGIPILVPGEVTTKDIIDDILNRYNAGVEIVGLKEGKLIEVI